MARQYQKTNWQNTPSTATPLSADNLNHIEDGIYNLETKVENNASAVSNLQSGKVDKVTGKGLSTNDFTDSYKSIIETNQANVLTIFDRLRTKVDKVTGKGLSTNDFTDNDVDKLRNDTYTKSETRGLVSKAYHPAGTIHVEDLTASILISANLNNVYNLDGDGTTSNLFIEGAGHPLKDGTNIGVINFGTDESPNILFDDLGGFVDLSGYATTSAMNTALAGKVDKVSGKGLSTNDFTDVYKSQIETNQGNILTLFDDKVDKEAGKGLSSNDFTSRYINAINDNTDNISDNTTAIQANANNITALQNNKVDKVVGKGLSTNDFTNNFKKGIAISQELAYDRATIPQPNLDADFHTVNGERTVIYQGNAYSFHTMTYNPISKKYVYGIMCSPVYQGGLFFCEVDNPASDRHNWLDTTTFPTDILINGDIYTAVMPTGEAYYVSYSYNNNDEKELVYCNALDSSRFDYWIKTEIIINSIFNIGNYIFYVADNKVYKYEFAHGSVELDFDTVPFAYTYGGGRCIALTKNQYNVISAFMSYDGIEWTKVNFPSINKTNKPSGLIYDHGIFLFYQKEDEYVITSKDGFSWEKHKLSINVTEYRENYMIFDEIGWGGGIFYACGNSVDEGHYDDYTIWTSQDGYTWEQTVKYLEDEIDNKTDYYNGTYIISVAQNLYYPTYRLDGVYGKGDVYTKSESNSLVIANPTDEAEGTLNKLKVNGTTYNLPQGGETNVQADWTETDPTSSAYIQHKPNLGTAASKDVPTSGNATSTQVVMGNDSRLTNARPASDVSAWAKASTKPTYTASEVGAYTTTEVDNKIADTVSQCYHPSGSKTVAELISSLLVSANEGNVYDMSDSGTTTSDFREGAGHPIKAGDNVGIVNVGTIQSPVYKFDLLSGFVDLSAYYTKTESDNKYVAKETGKGLSTNDYTTADKNKLAGIEAEANKTVVDSAMSDSSTNPLQNKVITKELEGAKTTSGNPLAVTDAASVNAVNLSMDLEPIQDLHGYDHPWVGGAGKNKLSVNESTISQPDYIFNNTDIDLPAGTYTFSFESDVTTYLSIAVKNANGVDIVNVYINYPARTYTFTISEAGKSVRLYGYAGTYTKMQIEAGSTATTFEPYSNICPISGRSEVAINRVSGEVSDTYTIQLGDTIYGGTLDVTKGELVVDRGYKVYDGSSDESWNSDRVGYRVFVQIADIKSNTINVITNRYKYVTAGETYQGLSGFSIDLDILFIGCLGYSVADWETYLASNPLQVCYELAEPFTIDLTPQQIELLENTNTLSSDGTITLEYQPNNAIGEAVRVVEESYDPEFAVRPVLKKKAFSGTTDSDGAVTLINASDIPSGHRIIPLQITDMTINGSAGTYFVEYEPYNSGDSVKAYCYTFFNGSRLTPVGSAVTGNFYYYDLEV